MKFRHISRSNTLCCVLHVTTITLFWLVTFIHTYTYAQTRTHMHTHTDTHTHTRTHTDLIFVILWKDRKIKYTRNWDNAGPRNLTHGNSCFLMKTLDLKERKLREINYNICIILTKLLQNARWGSSFLVKFHASRLQLY